MIVIYAKLPLIVIILSNYEKCSFFASVISNYNYPPAMTHQSLRKIQQQMMDYDINTINDNFLTSYCAMIPSDVTAKEIENSKNHISHECIDFEKECKSGQTFLQGLAQRDRQESQKRRNDKNKFINKLRQLNSQPGSDGVTFHKTIPTVEGEEHPFDRKQRNKIAARQSRDRKKLYIKLMQTKIQNLELQVSQASAQIQKFRMQIFNVQMHQDNKKKQVKNKQMHIMKKLEGLVNASDIEDRNNEINICLDSIIYRVGAMGNERKAALDKLYCNLINFSQPALYRYMLWSAVRQKHLFQDGPSSSSNQDQKWCKEIQQIAEICTLGRVEILAQIRQKLSYKKLEIVHSSERLLSVKGEVEKKGQYLDNIVNEIRQILSPQQVAQLILFVQRHQFKKQVRLFEDEEEGQQRPPQKKVKVEQDSDYPIFRVV